MFLCIILVNGAKSDCYSSTQSTLDDFCCYPFLQGIYIYYACSVGWSDVATISAHMIKFAKTGFPLNGTESVEYYQYYPNNLACTFIYGLLLKVVNGLNHDPYFLLACISAVFTDLSGILLYVACKKICNDICAMFSCVFYFALLGFSHILITPYTDTLGMFFTLLVLNAYLCYKETDGIRVYRFFWIGAVGVLSAVGYLIKPTVFILSIAIFLATIFFRGSSFFKRAMANFGDPGRGYGYHCRRYAIFFA